MFHAMFLSQSLCAILTLQLTLYIDDQKMIHSVLEDRQFSLLFSYDHVSHNSLVLK